MVSSHQRRPATYADLEAVPDHLTAEILDGELFTSPRPTARHAQALSMVGADLGGAFGRKLGGSGPGGWWILDEPELHLHSDVLVSDLAGWRRERMPTVPDVAYFEQPPDWVCEILSPSTARLDRVRKMGVYAREQVPWLWLIDPKLHTLEVYKLEREHWSLIASYEGNATARVQPFEQIELAIENWWIDPETETNTETP